MLHRYTCKMIERLLLNIIQAYFLFICYIFKYILEKPKFTNNKSSCVIDGYFDWHNNS
jgi:hypothetical protein